MGTSPTVRRIVTTAGRVSHLLWETKNPGGCRGPEPKLGGCHVESLHPAFLKIRAQTSSFKLVLDEVVNITAMRTMVIESFSYVVSTPTGVCWVTKLGRGPRRRHLSHGNHHLFADPCAHPRTSRIQIPNTGVLSDSQIPLMGPKDPRLLGFRHVGHTHPSLNKTFQVRLLNELLQQNPWFSYHYGRMSDIESMDLDTS